MNSTIKSLDLKEAAEFLGLHPSTLQARARGGVIPGAKVGRAWRFLDADLVDYLRAQYPANKAGEVPQSRAASRVQRGGATSRTAASAFDEALALPTRKRK